jgi:hypothetical protein
VAKPGKRQIAALKAAERGALHLCRWESIRYTKGCIVARAGYVVMLDRAESAISVTVVTACLNNGWLTRGEFVEGAGHTLDITDAGREVLRA